jgi:hypothetical protein
MAITPLVQGVQREIWREFALQGGGVAQDVHTGIRISAPKLACVQGLLTIDTPTGNPVFAAVPYVGTGIYEGLLQVQVTNLAGGGGANSGMWTLDVRLVQSPSQANRGNTGYILTAQGASSGGILAPETLKQAYDIGVGPADQTLTLTDAHGGGLLIDGTDAGFTIPGSALEIRAGQAWSTPVTLSRYTDDAVAHVLEFTKARGTFAAPANVQVNDAIGTINFNAQVTGGPILGAAIEAVCLAQGGATLGTALDFHIISVGAAAYLAWRIATGVSPIDSSALIGYGSFPLVYPNTNNVGGLGQANNIWSVAYLGNANLYHASDDVVSSIIQFSKSRGSLAVPTDINASDELGSIDFYGRVAGAPVLGAKIVAVCTAVPGGVQLTSVVDFYTMDFGVSHHAWRMDTSSASSGELTGYGTNPLIVPNTDSTGHLGVGGSGPQRWLELNVLTANVYANVCLGGAAIGGGAKCTVLLPNASGGCAMPVPQANQVYLGSLDFTVGSFHAVLAISAEEPALEDPAPVTTGIPINYNGVDYYLHASLQAPG